jgi:hypothetical protein
MRHKLHCIATTPRSFLHNSLDDDLTITILDRRRIQNRRRSTRLPRRHLPLALDPLCPNNNRHNATRLEPKLSMAHDMQHGLDSARVTRNTQHDPSIMRKHIIQQPRNAVPPRAPRLAVVGLPKRILLSEPLFERHVRERSGNLGAAAPAVARVHAEGLAGEFLDARGVGVRGREWERREGQVCGLDRAGQRRDVVCLWGGEAEGEVRGPEVVRCEGLGFAQGGEVGVGPDEGGNAVEGRVVGLRSG